MIPQEDMVSLWDKHRDAERIMFLLSKIFSYGEDKLPVNLSPYTELRDMLVEAFGGLVSHEQISDLLMQTYKRGKWQDVCKYYLLEAGVKVQS